MGFRGRGAGVGNVELQIDEIGYCSELDFLIAMITIHWPSQF